MSKIPYCGIAFVRSSRRWWRVRPDMTGHAALATGRWSTLTLAEQLANVGSEVERTITRTVGVFDLVAGSSPLRDRVLVIENDDDHETLRGLAESIASELRVSADASGVSRPPRTARISPDRLHAGE